MTIKINQGGIPYTLTMTVKKIPEPVSSREKWEITFNEPVDSLPEAVIRSAARYVSYLWDPEISRTSSNKITYSGYID